MSDVQDTAPGHTPPLTMWGSDTKKNTFPISKTFFIKSCCFFFLKSQKMLPTILNKPSGQPHPFRTSGFISWVAKLMKQEAWIFYVP